MIRDLLELLAIALLIAVVAIATHLLWPPLLATALAAAYLSHAWSWDNEPSDADNLRAALGRVSAAARKSQVSKIGVLDAVDAVIAVGNADEE